LIDEAAVDSPSEPFVNTKFHGKGAFEQGLGHKDVKNQHISQKNAINLLRIFDKRP